MYVLKNMQLSMPKFVRGASAGLGYTDSPEISFAFAHVPQICAFVASLKPVSNTSVSNANDVFNPHH